MTSFFSVELLRHRSGFVSHLWLIVARALPRLLMINIAMLAKTVTTLQKKFQQICDALTDKLGHDSDFSDEEGCNNESADGRSDSGSQVHYHKGTTDEAFEEPVAKQILRRK